MVIQMNMLEMENKPIGFYIKDGGDTVEDTIYTDCLFDPKWPFRLQVDEICEWIMSNNDGSEWLETGTVLTIVIDGQEVGDYEITVDWEPTFYSEKIEE